MAANDAWAAYFQFKRPGNDARVQIFVCTQPNATDNGETLSAVWFRKQPNESSRTRWSVFSTSSTGDNLGSHIEHAATRLLYEADFVSSWADAAAEKRAVVATLRVDSGMRAKCLEQRGAPWPLINRFKPRMLAVHGISI